MSERPGVLVQRSILTGRVPESLYKLEHPLDYEELLAAESAEARVPEAASGAG